MKRINRSAILAWLLSLICVSGASVSLIMWLLNQNGRPAPFELSQALVWSWGLPVLFSILAAMIIARQPQNRVGWLLMLPALVTVVPIDTYLAAPRTVLTPGLWLLLWYDNWSWIPVIFPVFLIPLHFPNGRPPSAKWNWINWLALGMWLFFMLLTPFFHDTGPMNYEWTLSNPVGFIPVEVVDGPVLIVWGIGLITLVSASVLSLLVRYHRAQSRERQQIKWLLYAAFLFVFVYTFTFFLSDTQQSGFASGWVDLSLSLSILTIAVAIGIAILRYQLFDIDVIIRKTAVYAVLSALLGLVYFGSIILLQTIFETVTDARSPVIIVVSTLLIAALFTPLRQRVQAIIDRRFFRQKYDAQQVLAQFAQTARDEVSLEALTAELTSVVRETIQPEQISVWLKPVSDSKRPFS